MKFSDLIASTALATGLVKMYMDFENSADVDIKFKNSIIFGNFTFYTVTSLLLQLYVLKNIMDKESNLSKGS